MTDDKLGREMVKHLASLIDLMKEGNRIMAKASRVAVKTAQAQENIAAALAAQGRLLAKIAEKMGVSLEDETDEDEGETKKPLDHYTVIELRQMAADNGVEVTGGMYKGDIIAALEAHFAENAG